METLKYSIYKKDKKRIALNNFHYEFMNNHELISPSQLGV